MGVFEAIGADTHEEVLFGLDPVSGLKAIIAIHSTALGPALGGTRFYPYQDEAGALADVLRLSKAMSYKAAAAGLTLGGGKAVIVGDPRVDKTERLLRAYGRTVDSLGGRYITAADVGTTTRDMIEISRETRWVAGMPEERGGSGDPSPATARGIMAAMRVVAGRLWGSEDLSGRTVAVQGVGKVGGSLVERLAKAGARTIVADTNEAAAADIAREHGSTVVSEEEILAIECDILAPCAMGGALTESTIPQLRCEAVVGAANNQLADPSAAGMLADSGVLYAPDFVVNAGGIINISEELAGYGWERAAGAVDRIAENLNRVLDTAEARGVDAHTAAVELAEDRIARIGSLGLRWRAHNTEN